MKKKIVSGILIAATVLALTGCGSSDEKQISGNVNNNEQAKTQQQKGAGSSKDNSKNENTGKDYVFKINNTEITMMLRQLIYLQNLGIHYLSLNLQAVHLEILMLYTHMEDMKLTHIS